MEEVLLCSEFLGPRGPCDHPPARGDGRCCPHHFGRRTVRATLVQATGVGYIQCPPSHIPGSELQKGRSLIRGIAPCPEIICLQSAPRGELASMQPEEQIASIFHFHSISQTFLKRLLGARPRQAAWLTPVVCLSPSGLQI